MQKDFALVLQGGGVRGAFTAGVLDVLMEQEIWANYVIGVSAGALNGMNYVSKQIGRSKWVLTDLMRDRKFFSRKNIFFHGSIFNFDYLFANKGKKFNVFDDNAFLLSKVRYIACATNLLTGGDAYFEKGVVSNIQQGIRASASLPLVSKPVFVDKIPCLDGGISVIVPLKKAIEDGNKKIVVVMTRQKGYRKDVNKDNHLSLAKKKYHNYPKFIEVFKKQASIYNSCVENVESLQDKKENFVIYPNEPIVLSRMEKSKQKLVDLYSKGRQNALEVLPKLLEYLNE